MDTLMYSEIKRNYMTVKERVAEAAYKTGRNADEVRIIAVTKFVDTERIRPVFDAGCVEVGENRAQELTDKYDFFREHISSIHFIGQLQLNKVKYLVGKADLIQSADRWEAFFEINRLALARKVVQDTLVEVNIGDEIQKAGVAPDKLTELLKRISDLPCVRVSGLMCIPPAVGDADARPYFARMRELFDNMHSVSLPNIEMRVLSMGMSGDYTSAIAEGANMVRVGSAIFGQRQR